MDIHILETHSSYFEAQKTRQPSYVCIVLGCNFHFWTSTERDNHLRSIHRFSSITRLYGLERQNPVLATKGKKLHKKSAVKSHVSMCRFYTTMEGCRYGSKCKFSHDENMEATEEESIQSNTLSSLLDHFESLNLHGSRNSVDKGKRRTKVQL